MFIHLPLFSGRFTERGVIKILRALEQGPTESVSFATFSPNGSRREEGLGMDSVFESDDCNLLAAFLTDRIFHDL